MKLKIAAFAAFSAGLLLAADAWLFKKTAQIVNAIRLYAGTLNNKVNGWVVTT